MSVSFIEAIGTLTPLAELVLNIPCFLPLKSVQGHYQTNISPQKLSVNFSLNFENLSADMIVEYNNCIITIIYYFIHKDAYKSLPEELSSTINFY